MRRLTRFRRHEDAYTLDRSALWTAVRRSIDRQTEMGKPIWLIAHFPETFESLQSLLADWNVTYDVILEPLDPATVQRAGLLAPDSIKLVLAPLIPDTEPLPIDRQFSQSTAVMVVERHPNLHHDNRIEQYCRNASFPVELGYFLALDDAILAKVVNGTAKMILEQLGMGRHDLITSSMVSRRLQRYLKKTAANYRSDVTADNAAAWIEINSTRDGSSHA